MNFKPFGILISVAIIMCFVMQPVGAVFQNGNWITDDKVKDLEKEYKLSYNPETDVTSKIRELPNVPGPFDSSGFLKVQLSCHHNLISKEIILQRVDATGIEFVNGAIIQKDFADKFKPYDNETGKTLVLDNGGLWEDFLPEGTFLITLIDGNGGQPEYAVVSTVKGYTTYVNFIGHGVGMAAADNVCYSIISIIEAKYGMIYIKHSTQSTIPLEYKGDYESVDGHYNYIGENLADWDVEFTNVGHIDHPKVNPTDDIWSEWSKSHPEENILHQENLVIDVPAYDETVIDAPAYDETVIDAPAYDETVIDVPAYDETIHHDAIYSYQIVSTIKDYQGTHDGHANPVNSNSPHDFVIGTQYYQITSNKNNPAYTQTLITQSYDQTVHHDAVTHVVHHDAVTHMEYRYLITAATDGKEAWIEYLGDYSQDGSHYNYVGLNLADYDVSQSTNVGHTDEHDSGWSDWKDGSCASVGKTNDGMICKEQNAGSYTNVKDQLQNNVVSQGYTSFMFDNSPVEGGIFDVMENLILKLDDPAYGVIKSVEITYNTGCGNADKTIIAQEGQIINLV